MTNATNLILHTITEHGSSAVDSQLMELMQFERSDGEPNYERLKFKRGLNQVFMKLGLIAEGQEVEDIRLSRKKASAIHKVIKSRGFHFDIRPPEEVRTEKSAQYLLTMGLIELSVGDPPQTVIGASEQLRGESGTEQAVKLSDEKVGRFHDLAMVMLSERVRGFNSGVDLGSDSSSVLQLIYPPHPGLHANSLF